ncbi:MAG: ABC transporter permease [Kofleriaceae bacterium]|nr:ABC transporter permease [Kofleriaceae bacterium]
MINKQALVVARREFLERVRTKWFAIVTILGPIGMIAAIVIPVYLALQSAEEGFHVQLVDKSGRDIGSQMNIELDARGVKFKMESVASDTSREVLEKRIADEEIDGYLEIPSDVLSGGTVWYRGDNTANPMVTKGLARIVDYAVFRTRGKDLGLGEVAIATLFVGTEFKTEQTTGDGGSASGTASFIVGYAVMFLLYMSIILYATAVLRSVILEKNNRVVEIIVSSIKPMPLMLGKVVGVGCVGLFQLLLWGVMAGLIITFREEVLGLFGLPGAGQFELPALGIGAIAVIIAYFLMGFFFYAALYAAIGAMVNSEQEAQQAQAPVMLLLMIPVLCVQIVAGDPRGGVAELLTMIPFSSPILMPMRYVLGAASVGEILISLAILAVSLIGAIYVAAKVYRVGILSYGKKPSLSEVWRWIRS